MRIAIGLGVGAETPINSAPPPMDPASTAYFAAMAVQPDAARKTLINSLIVGLKADGLWTKLDWLSLVASHDAQAARLNAVNPAQTMTAVASPTFVVDRGYSGDGATSYLRTDWNPTTAVSPNFAQNNAHHGVWMGTDVSSTTQFDFGNNNNRFNSYYDATRFYSAVNGTGAFITPGVAPVSTGHWTQVRPDGTGFQTYKNGATNAAFQAQASMVLANSQFLALAFNSSVTGTVSPNNFSTRRVQVAHWGSQLSAADVSALYNRLLTYMTAIGA